MNTARIVVLTIAAGALGAAAGSACGAGSRRPSSRARHDGGPLAPNSTAPVTIRSSARDHRAFRRGDDINVAMQK
jgi:hypothetical protein